MTIGQDIASLSQRIIKEAGADGIYLSVQSIQDARVSQEVYKQVIAPSELHVLETAKEAGGVNILHICGYEGARNISISSQITQPQCLTGQSDQKESVWQKDAKSSVDVRFLVGLKMAKMVFSTQETRLLSKQKPNASSQRQGLQAWSSVRIVPFQVTLMKNESNGFVKLQQNKENRKRENRV